MFSGCGVEEGVVTGGGEVKDGLGVVGEFREGNRVKLLLYIDGVWGCMALSSVPRAAA